MNVNLKELLKEQGIDLAEMTHRSTTVTERPNQAVVLQAVGLTDAVYKKTQKDPTDDLIDLGRGLTEEEFTAKAGKQGYLVFCEDSLDVWYCPTQLCLDQNFIYREDLKIVEADANAYKTYYEVTSRWSESMIPRRTCYILDCPAAEQYEVYYDSSYPSLKYGKATPNGMFVHKYPNRFHRDMAILELDAMYSESSKAVARMLTQKAMGVDDAIIVSDGAWMKNSCSCSCYFLSKDSLVKLTEGFLPSEGEQAVLTAEIKGAYNALGLCYLASKKHITYYYDNTSILNVFRNKKTEYIREVKEYKDFLKKMDSEGFDVQFVELHPKTGEDRAETNKGLMFFHNYCDKECREMADIFSKKYADIAKTDDSKGVDYKSVLPKQKPNGGSYNGGNRGYNGGGNRPQNNSRNGNNRYGRKY